MGSKYISFVFQVYKLHLYFDGMRQLLCILIVFHASWALSTGVRSNCSVLYLKVGSFKPIDNLLPSTESSSETKIDLLPPHFDADVRGIFLRVRPEVGYIDVAVSTYKGMGNSFEIIDAQSGSSKLIGPEELANLLLSRLENNANVRLFSCCAAKGEVPLAQTLASSLGVRVKAMKQGADSVVRKGVIRWFLFEPQIN